jgi:hypothetical protein
VAIHALLSCPDAIASNIDHFIMWLMTMHATNTFFFVNAIKKFSRYFWVCSVGEKLL